MALSLFLIGLLALLVFGLGLFVSLGRQASATPAGSTTDPANPLYRRVRAHGNAAEYAPIMALLIFVIGSTDPGLVLQLVMVLGVASRYLHAAGMLLGPSLAEVQPLRFVGALGTYLTGLLMALELVRRGLALLLL